MGIWKDAIAAVKKTCSAQQAIKNLLVGKHTRADQSQHARVSGMFNSDNS